MNCHNIKYNISVPMNSIRVIVSTVTVNVDTLIMCTVRVEPSVSDTLRLQIVHISSPVSFTRKIYRINKMKTSQFHNFASMKLLLIN